nr:tyrosine-type recombinase/integrase [Marinobacter halotolerans]
MCRKYQIRWHPTPSEIPFGARLLRAGSDIWRVQNIVRHSNIPTTEIYTHVVSDRRA